MKLFRHYKNQLYKYVGLVRHSETEEELVLYETRYACESGRIWVRPKKMFFDSIVFEDRVRPRFEPLELRVRRVTEFTPADLELVAHLSKTLLGDGRAHDIESRLREHANPLLLIGTIEDEPVAFKLGYEAKDGAYYSWLGGVLEAYRGLGYADDLMRDQHAWAKENGYARVRTKTLNRWRGMLLLNIRAGFQITGTEAGARGLKIVLEKDL